MLTLTFIYGEFKCMTFKKVYSVIREIMIPILSFTSIVAIGAVLFSWPSMPEDVYHMQDCEEVRITIHYSVRDIESSGFICFKD